MAQTITINSATLGTSLTNLLMCEEITPGSSPSYEICKVLYLWHPLGRKMAETPVKMAQSLGREISIAAGPEEDLKQAFLDQQKKDNVEETICNVGTLARVYGISSLALVQEGEKPDAALDLNKLADAGVAFNVLDPLNTAGSLVLNQNPNSIDYQKHSSIAVNGVPYHRSRTVTLMNEQPVYIAYTQAAFGFVGRSVFQRALFPLKSFINTMITDDMVSRKAGLIIASLKMAGSIVDAVMSAAASFKRNLLRIGETENVISIGTEESVSSLDLANIDGAMVTARRNILMNIATAADMPARLLNHETFADGFGEGSEDAKAEALYIDGIRSWLSPLYEFMDMVTMHRAWNENFFKSLQSKYESLKGKSYTECFYEWQNSFEAKWPSLLRESESEMVRIDDAKMRAVIAMIQVFSADADFENKVRLLEWAEAQVNGTDRLFSVPLELDFEALRDYMEEKQTQAQNAQDKANEAEVDKQPPLPRIARDSALGSYLGKYDDSDIRQRIVDIEKHLRGSKRNVKA